MYVNRNYVQNIIIMLPESINSILFHKILCEHCLDSILSAKVKSKFLQICALRSRFESASMHCCFKFPRVRKISAYFFCKPVFVSALIEFQVRANRYSSTKNNNAFIEFTLIGCSHYERYLL